MSSTKMPVASDRLSCLACGQQNDASVNFCAGCGQSQFEPCHQCSQPVRLEQKFCGGCGTDLEALLNSKREQYVQWLAKAIELGKKYEFAESFSLLERVMAQGDRRYSDLAGQAKTAFEKITAFEKQTLDSVTKTIARAKLAAEKDDKPTVVRLLNRLPAHLRDEESQALLAQCQSHGQQVTELVALLQGAMKELDYSQAGPLLDQLLELNPGEEKFRKLATQVSAKLTKSAERRLERNDFVGAIAKLECVCACGRDADFEQRYQEVKNMSWLAAQVEQEPWITPAVTKLAIRFAKALPTDTVATERAKKMVATLKKRSADPRQGYPACRTPLRAWWGGTVGGLLAMPSCVQTADEQSLRGGVGRFNLAIGLAMGGLGTGRFSAGFTIRKSLLGGLAKRKKDTCWGVDVGSAGIRAVQLKRVQANKKEPVSFELQKCYASEFETSIKHVSMIEGADTVVQEGLQKFKQEVELGDEPVWVNLCGSQLINRFIRLPPVSDKQAAKLLEREIADRIPFPLDELEVIRDIADVDEEATSMGRLATIVATRKHAVQERLGIFKSAGIEVAGLQASPLALVNLAAVEFAGLWQTADPEQNSASNALTSPHAVALLDAGASNTTLVLVLPRGCWFWTLEMGGDELTSIVARTTGKVHAEAEQLKRDPALIAIPADSFELINERLSQCRMRLEKLIGEAEKQLGNFEIKQSWCLGGTALTHGWMRQVTLEQ